MSKKKSILGFSEPKKGRISWYLETKVYNPCLRQIKLLLAPQKVSPHLPSSNNTLTEPKNSFFDKGFVKNFQLISVLVMVFPNPKCKSLLFHQMFFLLELRNVTPK